MSGMGMYECWQSPSLGKRARSPVELRQDLQKSRDADAADDLDNLHSQKRYLSEVIACGLSKLNFNMSSDDHKGLEKPAGSLMDCSGGPIPPRFATYSIHTPSAGASPNSPTSSCSSPPSAAAAAHGSHHNHHHALLPRSFSQIEQQPMRDMSAGPARPAAAQAQQQQAQVQRPPPHSPSVQQPLHLEQPPPGGALQGSSSQQERFASPTDTKAKLDLRKTALLRSLLIRTESNAKQLEQAAAEGWMDADDDEDQPMALSPTPELPEVSCDGGDEGPYGCGVDTMEECSSGAHQHGHLHHHQQQPHHHLHHHHHQHHQQQYQQHQPLGAMELGQPRASPPGSPGASGASALGIAGSFLWRGQQLPPTSPHHHQHHHHQQQQQYEPAAASAAAAGAQGDGASELPADRLEQVRAKALAGSRISASELEARPKQQFPTLPHLRNKPGPGGIMRRTSSHI